MSLLEPCSKHEDIRSLIENQFTLHSAEMARKVPRTQRGVPRTQRTATHYNTRQDIVPAEKVYAEEAREVP